MTSVPCTPKIHSLPRHLLSRYPTQVALQATLSLIQSAFAAFSLLALSHLIRVLQERKTSQGIDTSLSGTMALVDYQPTISLFIAYLFFVALSTFLFLIVGRMTVNLREEIVVKLRRNYYSLIFNMAWEHVGKRKDADITRYMLQEVGRVGLATENLLGLWSASILVLGYLFVAFYLSPIPSLFILMVVLLIYLSGHGLRSSIKLWGERREQHLGQLSSHLSTDFSDCKRIKLSALAIHRFHNFSTICRHLAEAHIEQRYREGALRMRLEILLSVALLLMAVGLFHFPSNLTGPIAVILIFSILRVFQKSINVYTLYTDYLKMAPSWSVVRHSLTELGQLASKAPKTNAVKSIGHWNTISFRSVSFSYPGATTPTLHSINLVVHSDRFIGICGSNGSGKTTLIDLLSGLLQAQSGSIIVDQSTTLTTYRQWSDSRIQYLGQHNRPPAGRLLSLFDLESQQNTSQTRDQIINCLELVELSDKVNCLPDGLDTYLGQLETVFSGGEIQRLYLAAALNTQPKYLILDESFSQIDTNTERRIFQRIKRKFPDLGGILVSHRTTSLQLTDEIINLTNGTLSIESHLHGEHDKS